MNLLAIVLISLLSASCPLLASVKGSGFCTPASAVPLRPSVEPIVNRKSKNVNTLAPFPLLPPVNGSGSTLCPSVESIVNLLAELPSPSPAAFGSWLISAVAALSVLALGKQFIRKTPIEAEFLTKREFHEFRDKVDASFNSLRDRIDDSHESLSIKLDSINARLSEVGSLVARLDERTKYRPVVSTQDPEAGNPS